jgi:hypothetical protein
LSLLWDLNGRNHEITLLRIKHIRLRERYGEGEIPHQAKTGSGPILLTFSFPYVRDWLNEHPFRNTPEARLICSLNNGAPIKPEALWTMMNQLRLRISRLIETDSISDKSERERLRTLLNSKRFNLYCLRHSSISYDSDYGITDKPIEGIKEFSIQRAQVKGITEAKGQRGDFEYHVKHDWLIPIQFPSAVSTSVKIQES